MFLPVLERMNHFYHLASSVLLSSAKTEDSKGKIHPGELYSKYQSLCYAISKDQSGFLVGAGGEREDVASPFPSKSSPKLM